MHLAPHAGVVHPVGRSVRLLGYPGFGKSNFPLRITFEARTAVKAPPSFTAGIALSFNNAPSAKPSAPAGSDLPVLQNRPSGNDHVGTQPFQQC